MKATLEWLLIARKSRLAQCAVERQLSENHECSMCRVLISEPTDSKWSRLCKYVGKRFIFGSVKKIDLIERPTSDDCVLRNGFGTPKFSAFSLHFVFLHTLGRCRCSD